MIDERHEELAALHALDLLEGEERAAFERALAADPALQTLVRELREASASLAHSAPAAPAPDALKARILASIERTGKTAPAAAPDNVIRPGFGVWQILPWAAAACFGLCAVWLGQRASTAESQIVALRNEQTLTKVSLQTALQQLEIDRLVSAKAIEETTQKLAAATSDLGAARTQLAARDTEVATLTGRIAALTESSTTFERQLTDSRQQIARLTEDLRVQGDIARYQVTALVSMLEGAPKAVAAAVWDPTKQEGVLKVEKLPALLPSQDYQLWVVDPQYPNPVDGGVFTVDPETGTRKISFKAKQPISSVAAFAVTLERKGGVPKAEGPFVLLGK
ncbi:MAG: anti-sigma factor [Opitutaceae bacterium]|nr:anti-sigma factor [Opitutaceae bacterium]